MTSIDELSSWYANWKSFSVAILGIGKSGFAAADSLCEVGADVTVYAPEKQTQYNKLLEVIGAKYICTELDEFCEIEADFAVVSPGISSRNRAVEKLRKTMPVLSEIELAWRMRDKTRVCPWLLITGTNGKTTTALLAEKMIAKSGARTLACGNIGTPVLDAIRDPKGFDFLVIELSSAQLSLLPLTGPGAVAGFSSVCINLDEDHLEWHTTYDLYRQAKARVYHGTERFCLYNLDDVETRKMVEEAEVAEGVRAVGFGPRVPGISEIGIVDGVLCDRAFLSERYRTAFELANVKTLKQNELAMPHIMSDILCAAALARSVGVHPVFISQALSEFTLPEHRVEIIAEHKGVVWVSDSKATNPHAVAASLLNFSSVVLIFGGVLKGVDVKHVFERFHDKIKAAVIIGKDQSFVENITCKKIVRIEDCESPMSRAVEAAHSIASPGDTVLLSPGGASFDQFKSYKHRGDLFKSAVAALVQGLTHNNNSSSQDGESV